MALDSGGKELYHEIALNELQLFRHAFASGIPRCSLNLVFVQVQSRHIAPCKPSDFPCWASNTAAYIEHLHPLLDADTVCKVMFVACNCLVEWLLMTEATEMEALAPTIFVEVCG